jgi:drug/metabolite transporter (DMT)-like permease
MLYFLISLMVLLWSANFVVAKYALEELPPFALLFIRVLMSAALLLAIYFARNQRERKPLQAGDWKWFLALGLLGVAGNQTGFTVGIHYTTVGHSALIIALSPILVLVFAVRMKLESLNWQKAAGMALSFSGVAVLALEHGFNSASPTFTGDLLTFGGSLAFALYTVYGKRVSERYDTLTLNTFTYLAGFLAVVPVSAWQLFEVDWNAVSWKGWLGAFYMAAGASVAAYMIFYYALTKISATRVIAFSYLQPVLATILAVLLRGEQVTGHLLGGGALVLLGVYLAERGRG